jgi:hypothetical protein
MTSRACPVLYTINLVTKNNHIALELRLHVTKMKQIHIRSTCRSFPTMLMDAKDHQIDPIGLQIYITVGSFLCVPFTRTFSDVDVMWIFITKTLLLSHQKINSYGFSQTRTQSSAKNWPCLFINAWKLDLTVINKEPEWSVITHCQCNFI